MKNRPFLTRLSFALTGIREAYQFESSFKTQTFFAVGALILLIVLRPKPIWWALLFLTVGAVLAAELFNASLESTLDHIHPEQHPMVARAKDCAAGAVLILSISSLAVAAALIWDTLF